MKYFPKKLSVLLAAGVFMPNAVLAGPEPVQLTPDITPQITLEPAESASVESAKVQAKVQKETTKDKLPDGTTVETTTKLETRPPEITGGSPMVKVDGVTESNDFVAFASEHCRAFINEGRGNLEFALNKQDKARLSSEERAAFNRDFSHKIIQEYNIDISKPCELNVVSMKPVEQAEPRQRDRYVIEPVKREVAVVSGQLLSTLPGVSVSVAYRLEKVGASPWVLGNITFNGQPLINRYVREFKGLAKK